MEAKQLVERWKQINLFPELMKQKHEEVGESCHKFSKPIRRMQTMNALPLHQDEAQDSAETKMKIHRCLDHCACEYI
jgi:hypothetical protein